MKFKNLIKNVFLLFIESVCFYSLNGGICPLSVAPYAALISLNCGIVVPSVALVISFLRYKDLTMTLTALLFAAGTVTTKAVYAKKGRNVGVESVLFNFIFLSPYIVFYQGETLLKLLGAAVCQLFGFISNVAVGTIKYKGFLSRPSLYETFCIAAAFCVTAVGTIDAFGLGAYKAAATFIMLFLTRLYKNPTALAAAIVLAVPVAVSERELSYFAVSAAFFFAAYPLCDKAPVFAVASVTAVDAAFAFLFNFYPVYGYIEALLTFAGAAAFALVPKSVYDKIVSCGYLGGEKLSRKTIASVKSFLSGQIYDLSGAFAEMEGALSVLNEKTHDRLATAARLARICGGGWCRNCVKYSTCELYTSGEVTSLIDFGLSKGRVTLVDLNKRFLDECVNPNPLIFEVNRLIEGASDKTEKMKNAEQVKKILSLASLGVERRLGELAYNLTLTSDYDEKAEYAVKKRLDALGIPTFGVMVNKTPELKISLIVKKDEDVSAALSALGEYFRSKFEVTAEQAVKRGLKYLEIEKCADSQAVFGVSAVTKVNSERSGDVHSLLKLDEGRFLVALSDGMGSGEGALSTSSAAIGLIEGMLKAGLKSNVILPIVNELIAVSTEDNFSAVDIGVVDLKDNCCDFIKIGAPYGFILSDEGIRFVEGSSLPIGILSELKPTTAHTGTKEGDVIVMLSDGVTDAFGSSGDLINYLKSAPTKNPQALADGVVAEALKRTGGVAQDDMTCLCVRLCGA